MTLIDKPIRDFNTTELGRVRSDEGPNMLLVNFPSGVRKVERKRVSKVGNSLFIDAPPDMGKPLDFVPRKKSWRATEGEKRAERKKPGPKPKDVEPERSAMLGKPLLMEHKERLLSWGYSAGYVETMATNLGLSEREVYAEIVKSKEGAA